MKKTALLLASLLLSALLQPPALARAQTGAPVSPGWRIGGLLARSTIWPQYRQEFVRSDGRVVDTGNGGVSHSEGQGYGLLLAVAAGDRETFDRILDWTTGHLMVRDDNLIAWNASDANDAADADTLIAWALAEAVDYWRDPKYLRLAKPIAHNIASQLLDRRAGGGLLLKPGVKGFSGSERPDGPVVNPSYWVFPAFQRLRELAPDARWDDLQTAGLALIESARFGATRLVPDWVALGGDAPAPALGFPEGFGYNAIRIPLYVYWSGREAPELMRNFSAAWESGVFKSPKSGDGRDRAAFVEPGYAKIFALARCAASGDAYPNDFYDFTARQNYYPATLSALAIVAAAARGGPCLDAAAMSALLGGAAPELASDISLLELPAEVVAADTGKAPPRVLAMKSDEPAARPVSPTGGVHLSLAAEGAPGMIGSLALLTCLAGAGIALYRRRERQRKQRLETIFAPAAAAERGVPRNLPVNPYSASPSDADLPAQMERAALASMEFGRTLGVVYFNLGEPQRAKRKRPAPNRESDVEELVARLRAELRATDHAALINEHEVIACIGLLPGMTELTSVGERLRKVGQANEKFADAFDAPAGLAIYPLDGYHGEELIARARARHKTSPAGVVANSSGSRAPRKAAAATGRAMRP